MRNHRFFAALAPWAHDPAFGRIVASDTLSVLRIEPVTRGREPSAIVDAVFVRDGRAAVVGLAVVDLAQLDVREFDPLVFPAAFDDRLDDDLVRELNERVIDALERPIHAGGLRDERIVRFGDTTLFDAARERGALGAAPSCAVVQHLAAAVYARRFARRARVATFGPRAPEAAALVRDLAATVIALGGDDVLAAWYGVDAGEADPHETYDLAIGAGGEAPEALACVRGDGIGAVTVGFASPLALDRLFAEASHGSAAVTTVGVTHRREPVRRAAVEIAPRTVGGSAGRIAIVVRPDAALVPDADVDEAHALAGYLAGEGFDPVVLDSFAALEEERPDLVHLFGIDPGRYALDVCTWAVDRAIPVAIHAFAESPELGGWWGAQVTPFCFGYSADDRRVRTYLDLLARRAVEVDGVGAKAEFAPPASDLVAARRALRLASVVYVHSEREREAVAAHRPGMPTLVVPPMPLHAGDDGAVASLVGSDPFILVHAPIAATANQLVLLRAADAVTMPIVFAGPVGEPEYAEQVRALLGDAILIPEPDPARRGALYAAAAVVADAAWVSRGPARLAAAAAAGAVVTMSRNRWIDLGLPDRRRVDPADVAAVARGLGDALDAAARRSGQGQIEQEALARRLAGAGGAVVAGYAKIASTV